MKVMEIIMIDGGCSKKGDDGEHGGDEDGVSMMVMLMVMRMMGLMVVVYLCFVWVHELPWWVLLSKVAFGRIFIHEVCMHYY